MYRKGSLKRFLALAMTGAMLLGMSPISGVGISVTDTQAATVKKAISSKKLTEKDFAQNGGDVDLFTAVPAYNDLAGRDIYARIYKGNTGRFLSSDPNMKNARFASRDTSLIAVSANGRFTAKECGIAVITANSIEYPVAIVTNPGSVVFENTEFTDYYSSQDISSPVEHMLTIDCDDDLVLGLDTIEMTYTGNDITASIDYAGRTIYMTATKSGTRNITLTINGAETKLVWKVVTTKAKKNAILLVKGKTTTVTLKNDAPAAAFDWKSSNTKIATVDKNGKVKGKKVGNAVITGTVKGQQVKVGTVVSVSTKKKVKAIKKARSIGTVYGNGIYSQARRMTRPYYDCSSLVWEAYRKNGCNFGTKSYAPVAASECQYLEVRGKAVGKFRSKNVGKMKYNAGDVMFRTNTGNGRYRGINHIEMITGYQLNGFSDSGSAEVTLTWANRIPSYTTTINKCDLICRP